MSNATVRQEVRSLPIRHVSVRVLAGPDQGKEVRARADTLSVGTSQDNDLVLTDDTVSRYHAELHAHRGLVDVRDLGSTNGTFANGVRIERAAIKSGTQLDLGRTKLLVTGDEPAEIEVPAAEALGQLRGRSPAMRRLIADVERVARTDVSVLLTGETGVGKEAVAEAIHAASSRASGPFEIVDCGVLAPSLVASELFGHERGAFTGADAQRIGAFERAEGGTLLLDEIGELPMPLQSALLGALERRSFKRLGGEKTVQVNVRVLAATHRDLRLEVNAGRFRQDLYYRLAVVQLRVPPLRDRPDDIPVLVEHFLREAGRTGPVQEVIPDSVMQHLEAHQWPGNVRELRNFVDAALALGAEGALDSQPGEPTGGRASAGDAAQAHAGSFLRRPLAELYALKFKDARELALRDFEAAYLKALLERTDDNVSKAARVSDIHRSYLNLLLKRHQLR